MDPRRASKWSFCISLIAALAFLSGATVKDHADNGKDWPTRFRGLDRNNDGRVTRAEWHGSERSFSMHDRNGDGVIAGAESGADVESCRSSDTDANAASLPEDQYAHFTRLDRDGNTLISLGEWDGDRSDFDALDGNDDGAMSRGEFLNVSEARKALFYVFDVNGNGMLSRSEWKGDKRSFARLDTNADRKLKREEFIKRSDDLEQIFSGLDRDHNGRLDFPEWHGDKKAFWRLDDNHDGQLSLAEFVGVN